MNSPWLDDQSLCRGEKNLLWAVLHRAIIDATTYKGARSEEGQRTYRQIMAWFNSSSEGYITSFSNICSVLNLKPKRVRKAIEERIAEPGREPVIVEEAKQSA